MGAFPVRALRENTAPDPPMTAPVPMSQIAWGPCFFELWVNPRSSDRPNPGSVQFGDIKHFQPVVQPSSGISLRLIGPCALYALTPPSPAPSPWQLPLLVFATFDASPRTRVWVMLAPHSGCGALRRACSAIACSAGGFRSR